MSAAAGLARSVRRAWATLIALCLLACAAGAYTALHWQRAHAALSGADAQRVALRLRDAQLRQQSSLSESLQRAVDALEAGRFVARHGAPGWREALREAQRMTGIRDIAVYPLGEHPVHASEHVYPDVRIRESIVRLRIGALHEVELLHFLDALRDARAGIMRVRACSLRRGGGTAGPALEAHCEIGWSQALVAEGSSR
ncbi:MAG: hypothetical protein IT532_04090 [Burkholderiales bacterium]|nr:hypothetical protein [Burkholderiales bacterium]